MLPVKKQADKIILSPGTQLAGIRFHPAIGYGVLGKNYDKPTLLSPKEDKSYQLYRVYNGLRMQKNNDSRIIAMYQWANNNLSNINVIPDFLKKALECIEQDQAPGQLSEHIELSQRQIERHFNVWLGMAPKHYQRIKRVSKTICFLRKHKNVNLAGAALQFGFSDQAHMTREFRTIACITPRQI